MTVQQYTKEILSPTDSVAHYMGLAEPPLSLSASEVSDAVGRSKRVLKPGCKFEQIRELSLVPSAP